MYRLISSFAIQAPPIQDALRQDAQEASAVNLVRRPPGQIAMDRVNAPQATPYILP
jgi:hypothetical protein